MITKLLHDITQYAYQVQFQVDFKGMLSITFYEDVYNGVKYIRHEHLGYPDCPIEKLNEELEKNLNRFLEEIKNNAVEKDGLAK